MNTIKTEHGQRITGYNIGLAEMAGSVVNQSFCFYQTLVLIDSEVLLMPPLRQAINRYEISRLKSAISSVVLACPESFLKGIPDKPACFT